MDLTFDKIRKREKYLVEFYNRVAGKDFERYTDIPAEALAFLLLMNYEEIIRPLIRLQKSRGKSIRWSASKFGVTIGFARYS